MEHTSHPMLTDDGEIAEKWERYFSVALGGLLANTTITSMDGMKRINIETVMRLAKEIADKAVTVKPK